MRLINKMLNKLENSLPAPQTISRILLIATILLALFAGLFQELYRLENKKYAKLEDMYVRVRDQLGRSETQRLIDQSYSE